MVGSKLLQISGQDTVRGRSKAAPEAPGVFFRFTADGVYVMRDGIV